MKNVTCPLIKVYISKEKEIKKNDKYDRYKKNKNKKYQKNNKIYRIFMNHSSNMHIYNLRYIAGGGN